MGNLGETGCGPLVEVGGTCIPYFGQRNLAGGRDVPFRGNLGEIPESYRNHPMGESDPKSGSWSLIADPFELS